MKDSQSVLRSFVRLASRGSVVLAIAILGHFAHEAETSPTNGTLVICGGGNMPDRVMHRFVQAAGGSRARIVVVTTASEIADTPEIESELKFWKSLKLKSLNVLHTRSRETANDATFVEPLMTATGIWFIGGKQQLLTDVYLGTITEQLIHAVLRRGGVVGGTSAGAAIMSPLMICRGNPEPEVGPGFGFLPGTVIDQHFLTRNRQGRLLSVLSSHPDHIGLGIDEGTALIVQGRRMSVVGDSQVVACLAPAGDRPARMQSLKPGTRVDLLALTRAASSRGTESKNSALRHTVASQIH